jgi:hypothetical protein
MSGVPRHFIIAMRLFAAGALVAPAVAFAPASSSWAQAPDEQVGVRLLEAPQTRVDDPRARQYIIDHLRPTNSITRRFEVTNETNEAKTIRLYAGSARILEDRFVADDGQGSGDLIQWTAVQPGALDLAAGGAGEAAVTIDVPADAADGERYGVVWAELPPSETASGVTLVNRVGIRIYLSVGEGEEPRSDFVIEEFVAARDNDGRPVMRATVVNTGGRALDLTGELKLEDGPGSLSAGPFPVEIGTTLAPGDRAPAVIFLDPELPDGPWTATLTVTSGELSKTATARITFPDEPGTAAPAVKAAPVTGTAWGRTLATIAGLLLLLSFGLFFLFWRRRRRADEEEAERIPART